MSVAGDAALVAVGLALVLLSAERLVEGLVDASRGFGVSAFVLGVVLLGFDPENLAVGAASNLSGVSGFALGTVIGSCMVAVTLAFGLTALLAPMELRAPAPVLVLAPLAVILAAGLALDGRYSRTDGAVLLAAYAAAVAYVAWLGRRGVTVEPGGEVAESLEEEPRGRWHAAALFAVALVALVAGSELLVHGGRSLLALVDLSATWVGMTALALLVSVEEVARELPAAWRGRPDVSYGNAVGSVLAFFLFNAGVLAVLRPVPLGDDVVRFYLPAALVGVLATSALVARGRVGRGGGALLLLVYALFAAGGWWASAP